MLPAINCFIKDRLPFVHRGVRSAIRWWFIESRSSLEASPAVPRKVGGEWLWMHPRFLTEALDIEAHVLGKFREHIRPGDTVLDIGAYVGLHAAYAARLAGDRGRVFAFEPSPANHRYLAYHCRKNAPDRMVPVAQIVSDRAGERIPFHLLNDGDSSSNSITFSQLEGGRSIEADTKTIEVESTTLDAFCAQHDARPAFIKIDVEGAEFQVLRGGERVLRECKPTLIVALHPAWLPAGTTPQAIRDFLESAGYEMRTLDGAPVAEFALAEYLCKPRS
jgi:FkbM family methyltransferase